MVLTVPLEHFNSAMLLVLVLINMQTLLNILIFCGIFALLCFYEAGKRGRKP